MSLPVWPNPAVDMAAANKRRPQCSKKKGEGAEGFSSHVQTFALFFGKHFFLKSGIGLF